MCWQYDCYLGVKIAVLIWLPYVRHALPAQPERFSIGGFGWDAQHEPAAIRSWNMCLTPKHSYRQGHLNACANIVSFPGETCIWQHVYYQVEIAASGRALNALPGNSYTRAFIHPWRDLYLYAARAAIPFCQIKDPRCALVCLGKGHLDGRLSILTSCCPLLPCSCLPAYPPAHAPGEIRTKVCLEEVRERRLRAKEIAQVLLAYRVVLVSFSSIPASPGGLSGARPVSILLIVSAHLVIFFALLRV